MLGIGNQQIPGSKPAGLKRTRSEPVGNLHPKLGVDEENFAANVKFTLLKC